MDRTKELADALAKNPWVDEFTRRTCRALSAKWAEEDAAPPSKEGFAGLPEKHHPSNL